MNCMCKVKTGLVELKESKDRMHAVQTPGNTRASRFGGPGKPRWTSNPSVFTPCTRSMFTVKVNSYIVYDHIWDMCVICAYRRDLSNIYKLFVIPLSEVEESPTP